MSPDTLKVLERVKKLITLANDKAASEGERDNAMRMAHNTLAKYNLSMAEVDQLQGDRADPRVEEFFDLEVKEPWARTCVHNVAELFFCSYYYVAHRDGDRHYVIGKTVNVQTVNYMSMFIVNSIAAEAKKAQLKHKGTNALASRFGQYDRVADEGVAAAAWKLAFCQGAVQTISRRCREMIEEATRAPAGAPGTALVLASLYQREMDANRLMMPKDLITERSRGQLMVDSARAAGSAFGKGLSLNRQLGTTGNTRMIGSK